MTEKKPGKVEVMHNKTEEQLKYMTSAVEQSSEGMAVADLEGYILYINRAFAEAHGYAPEELTGKHLSIFHDANPEPPVEEANRQLLETGEFTGEIRHVRRDGSVFTILMRSTLLRDDEGNPIAMLGAMRDITEAKKAEEKLTASVRLYSSLFDHMLNGLAYCRMEFDEEGRPVDFTYLSVNEAFEKLTGLKDAEGKRVTDLIPSLRKSDPEIFEIYGRVSSTGVPERFERFVEALKMWFSVSVYCPERGYFTAVFDVITERKRIEEEQTVMLEALRLINEAEDWETLLKNIIGHLKKWSNCEAVGIRYKNGPDFPYFAVTGFTDAFVRHENRLCSYNEKGEVHCDADGNPILECMCGNILCGRFDPSKSFFTTDGSFWSNCTTELLATTTDADRQARTRNRCNSVGYESVALVPLRSGQETFGLIQFNDHEKGRFTSERMALFRKIADHIANFLARKEAEERVKAAEARYRTLFEKAAEGIVIIENGTGKFKYANPAFSEMLGYSEHELKAVTVKDIHTDKMLSYILSEINAHRKEGKPTIQHDVEFIRKDGAILFADVVTSPEILIDGEPCGAAFFIDTTRKKMAENEKKKLEAQLWQAQKLEAVGRLTGGVAHDFNNILTVIIGNAEMALQRASNDESMREYLDAVKDAGGRAAALTRQLLAFSRRNVLQVEVFSLREAVHDMEKMLRRLIGEDVELSIHCYTVAGMVETDRGQVEQIIMNLAVNSRDAMPGGGQLAIEVDEVEINEKDIQSHMLMNPGRYVRMIVSDTGEGMTEEVQTHIFEPFFTTKEKGKGTGLGLSIVYGIVKQSNGYIWVYSEPGKGTSFKIYLPAADKAARANERPSTAGEELISGVGTLLIAEDEKMIRDLIYDVLSESGYRVLRAADGREAVKILEEQEGRIDLLIADVVMPGMGGKELAAVLLEKCPGMKVLYMSGYTDNAATKHGILEKGRFFLQKPFTSSGLRNKVKEALRGKIEDCRLSIED